MLLFAANPSKRFGNEHMDGTLLKSVARELVRAGAMVLRFNYKQIGESDGTVGGSRRGGRLVNE